MNFASTRWFRGLLLGVVYITGVIGIVASGGGGGSGSSEGGGPAPSTAANPTLGFDTKTFRFTWTDVADATYYRLLENPDGFSGFSKVGGDVPQGTETVDHYVALYNRIDASYILQSCNENGCTDSNTLFITGTLVDAIGYLKASNTDPGDYLGNSVSLSADGTTLAIGAMQEDSNATGINGNQADNSASNSGVVYVFTRNGKTLIQQAYIKASNTDADDYFGWIVRLSGDGNTLVIGTFFEDSNATGINGNQADNSAENAGAVYVFTRGGNTWTQQAYIKASNSGSGDVFGFSISISNDGNTLAVGANQEDSNATGINGNQANNLFSASGAVYVFTRSGITWTQQAYVKASNTEAFDSFGMAVSLSSDGNTLVVGAGHEKSNATGVNGNQADNSIDDAGAVYVFTRSGIAWTQQAYVKASNTGIGDRFGNTVSLSNDGNTLAVGAWGESSNATGINGNQADNSAINAGAVYVFTRGGNTWTQQAYIKASNTINRYEFGKPVSLSGDGNTLAVGSPGENGGDTGVNGNEVPAGGNAGAVYVFRRSNMNWSQQAYVKASNTDIQDFFSGNVGNALAEGGMSISNDGNTLAVGANQEDSNATGINGNQADNSAIDAGAGYLY